MSDPIQEVITPTPLVQGKFALYETPKGGMHLSLQVDGEAEPRHVEIPPLMIRMMKSRFASMSEEQAKTIATEPDSWLEVKSDDESSPLSTE